MPPLRKPKLISFTDNVGDGINLKKNPLGIFFVLNRPGTGQGNFGYAVENADIGENVIITAWMGIVGGDGRWEISTTSING